MKITFYKSALNVIGIETYLKCTFLNFSMILYVLKAKNFIPSTRYDVKNEAR